MSSSLELLREFFKNYISDPKYVYKQCKNYLVSKNFRKWLIVLEKLEDTKTNEDRKDIADKRYAKYRANKLKVVKIFDINNFNEIINHIVNVHIQFSYGNEADGEIVTQYKEGEIVYPNKYDEDIDNVCSSGIHYFKEIDAAYLYDEIPNSYTGNCHSWYDNGQISQSISCVDGIITGKLTTWYIDGQITYEGEFLQGEQTGKAIQWQANGKKSYEGYYLNGLKSGKWTFWHENDEKEREGSFLEGNKIGIWTSWGKDGRIGCEGEYLKDHEIGVWKYWRYHKNDIIVNEINHFNSNSNKKI